MRVIFIGSNPSQRSKSIIPFWYDTRSTAILDSWIAKLNINITNVSFLNVSNSPTPNNRALKVSEIKSCLERLKCDIAVYGPDKIITLGKSAEKALTLLRLDFHAMPHPSGLNRLLNDPVYVEEKIKGLNVYLSPSKVLI